MLNQGVLNSILTEQAYVTNSTQTPDQSTYTFSSQSIGVADSFRHVIVGVGFYDGTNSMSDGDGPASVTVGGVSATLINQESVGSGSERFGASLWRAHVPTGTTADVVVVLPETVSGCNVGIHRLIHASGAPRDSDAVRVSTTTATTKSFSASKAGIGYAILREDGAAASSTWGGTASPTEEYDDTPLGFNMFTSASFTDAGTVQVSGTGIDHISLVAAVWS